MSGRILILNIFYGFCMALADSVPGVSGGTIAFILGFYEQLLESIGNITTRNSEKIKSSILFLVRLFIGWVIGVCISVLFLTTMFEKNIYMMTSLFIGLTFASVVYIIKTELKFDAKKLVYILLGIVLVVIISSFRTKIIHTNIVSLSNLSLVEYLYIFLSGMIAISAMVLPGISGSTLLLILGVYLPVIDSLHQILRGNFSVLIGLCFFVLGVLFGFITSVRLIRRAFRKNRITMIHFIIGLTIGSLYSIAVGPQSISPSYEVLNLYNFNIVGFIIGILILVVLENLRKICKR